MIENPPENFLSANSGKAADRFHKVVYGNYDNFLSYHISTSI